MNLKSPPFRWWPAQLPCALLCMLLGACVAPNTGAAVMPHGISEVVLERDCLGCGGATRLVLRQDGSASLTHVGKARLGTHDTVKQGRVSAAEFQALAQLLVQRGFFGMAESYADPAIQDGSWSLVRATRSGQDKQVFARDDAAPPGLRAVETAIATLQARIDSEK